MDRFAGVDVGATSLRAVVGDNRCRIEGRASKATPQEADGTAVTDAVLETLRAAAADAGVDPPDLRAVGVGSIGPLAGSAVDDPPNLPGVERVALAEPLAALADADEVTVRNDAVAGLVGERFHAEDPPENVVYLTISTGLGAGACVDGHVLEGRAGNAAEVGHVELDPAGAMTCGCAGSGHWEAYCSGRNVPRYARHLHDGEPTALAVDGKLTAAAVYDAAGDDQFATRVVERVTDWNVRGVRCVVHAFAPDLLVVGGSVALANPGWVVDPLCERVPDGLVVEPPDIRRAALGDDAVVVGALVAGVRGID